MDVVLSELAEVVRQLTGTPDPGDWHRDRIHEAIPSATRGIWRIGGEGWSTVLKVIGPGAGAHPHWQAGEDPEHWYYWRREALAYRSGLVSSLACGLHAPRCYLAAERPGVGVALWLEDLERCVPGTRFGIEDYSVASRRLGCAQGQFLVGRHLPRDPWLSRNWLRAYLSLRDADTALLADAAAWSTPLVRRSPLPRLADPLQRMRRDREMFLGAIERIPQTVCHLDLHPANLFAGDAQTVVIDWSFVGIGAIGEDAGNLVVDAVLDFHVRPEEIDRLFEAVRSSYVMGLRDAGWTGNEELVGLAMRALIAAKYAWIAPAMLRAALERRPSLNRRPIEDAFGWWAEAAAFIVRCAGEARHLGASIDS